ncbi:MAG: glycoside hydrolase family 3 N-terminal domain-containing protein [Bacteroidota bacterium]|nr:glycoside hydrolase family 3 N-terminal domain-containing protein [Bacteroidota bacterium]
MGESHCLPPVRLSELPPDSLLIDDLEPVHPSVSTPWVDSVFASMTLEKRIAQMIVPFTYGDTSEVTLHRLRPFLSDLGVGGLVLSKGTVGAATRLIEWAQSQVQVPLLISADFENGLGMRLRDAVSFPSAMAVGACRSPELAYTLGRMVAEESRALGVYQNYAPVVDVNNNPLNPVINIRSFGEEPELVAQLAEAYLRGIQDERVIATAKHFPGHGDTERDSHTDLPTLWHSQCRLDSVELVPFRHVVRAGVLAIMTGHLALAIIDTGGIRPATLSGAVLDSLLRGVIGFKGLIVTDAMNMKAVGRSFNNDSACVEAVRAGADIILMPHDPFSAVKAVALALSQGTLDTLQVYRSVRRILRYKEWLGLSTHRLPNRQAMDSTLQDSTHRVFALDLARRAATLVRNNSGILPLQGKTTRNITCLSFITHGDRRITERFEKEMVRRFPAAKCYTVERAVTRSDIKRWEKIVRKSSCLVLASFVKAEPGTGEITFSRDQRMFLERIARGCPRAVLISFGNPYVITAVPWVNAYICMYGDDDASITAGIEVLVGETNPTGALPITIPGIALRGTALGFSHITNDRTRKADFRRVDSLVEKAIRQHAFPGAQLLVIHGGTPVYYRSYGRLTYSPSSPVVDSNTMYDLASLTKVIATTAAAMKLVEEGSLDLDTPVEVYLPAFRKNGKEKVTVRNLLLHNSGLPAFRSYESFCSTAEQALDTMLSERLVYSTGTKTVYSDIGIIALGKVIESIVGKSLDRYTEEIFFKPLGMKHTMFLPPDSLKAFCAPTEYDSVWRHRLLQGEVHDERAALLGGVAGHAGLFSTATDLGRFILMLMNGGEFNGTRFLKSKTVEMFTHKQFPGPRALGWDGKSSVGSSAGRFFSFESFGHTGFTGTSIWVDPQAEVAVVFLTNRIHPTRTNTLLLPFRTVLHDAVRQALASIDSGKEDPP